MASIILSNSPLSVISVASRTIFPLVYLGLLASVLGNKLCEGRVLACLVHLCAPDSSSKDRARQMTSIAGMKVSSYHAPGGTLSTLHTGSHGILVTILPSGYHYGTHFTVEKTKSTR